MEQKAAKNHLTTNKNPSPDDLSSMPIGQKVRLALELSTRKSALIKSIGCLESSPKKENNTSEKIEEYTQTTLEKEPRAAQAESANVSSEIKEILAALKINSHHENVCLCEQLELLVRFDELQGWRESGAKNCAAWMNSELQIDTRTAWERLRVGRQLRELPMIHQFFKSGRLSWSKVRLLTRIASVENETMLVHASLDATVSDVQRLCEEYRWPLTDDAESDAQRANLQWERRRLNWRQLPDGSTQIRLVLPPGHAQNFLHAIEQCEELIYEAGEDGAEPQLQFNQDANDSVNAVREPFHASSSSQRKADAAVLLAERSVAFCGEHLAPADRYQVVLNIDTDSLSQEKNRSHTLSQSHKPPRNPMIEGIGRVPITTARQIACDCSVIKLLTEQGEPLSVGRKYRLWTPSMRRAILTRDRHCQFPGCHSHRFLQIHHIQHWADGGETSVDNGVCLCQFHHQLIHSGQFEIRRAVASTDSLKSTGLYSSSKKRLLPTRCRFVVKRTFKHISSTKPSEPVGSVERTARSSTIPHRKCDSGVIERRQTLMCKQNSVEEPVTPYYDTFSSPIIAK